MRKGVARVCSRVLMLHSHAPESVCPGCLTGHTLVSALVPRLRRTELRGTWCVLSSWEVYWGEQICFLLTRVAVGEGTGPGKGMRVGPDLRLVQWCCQHFSF